MYTAPSACWLPHPRQGESKRGVDRICAGRRRSPLLLLPLRRDSPPLSDCPKSRGREDALPSCNPYLMAREGYSNNFSEKSSRRQIGSFSATHLVLLKHRPCSCMPPQFLNKLDREGTGKFQAQTPPSFTLVSSTRRVCVHWRPLALACAPDALCMFLLSAPWMLKHRNYRQNPAATTGFPFQTIQSLTSLSSEESNDPEHRRWPA